MDTGFNYYFGADPSEYDLVVSNSEGGLDRLRELGARRAEAVFWGADPELFQPHAGREGDGRLLLRLRRQVPPGVDGGDDRRAEPPARRRLLARRPGLPRRHRPRAARRRRAVQRLLARDLGGADQPERHPARARLRLRLVHVAAVRAGDVRRDDRLQPARRASSAGSSRAASCSSSRTPTRRPPPTASCSTTRRRRRRWAAPPASARSTSTPSSTGRGGCSTCSASASRRPSVAEVADRDAAPDGAAALAVKRIAIVPAFNEEESVPRVIDEIRAFDPELRGRRRRRRLDRRDGRRRRRRAAPTSSGCRSTSGSAAPSRPASATRSRTASGSPCGVDGDGQHDPAQLGAAARPGARRRGRHRRRLALRRRDGGLPLVARRGGSGSRSSRRRVSLLVGRRVTDPTSGFQALNRHAIALFAADYPHDYPEVEAALMVHKHQLRMIEVPVQMRERAGRPVVDRRPRLRLLHGQGDARPVRRAVPQERHATGGGANDPARRLHRRRDRLGRC